MRARLLSLFLLSGLLLIALHQIRAEATNELAVIVNKTSATVTLSFRDLRSILLGAKESWPDGTKLLAVSLPSERPETRTMLKEVCRMSEGDFKRYFLMMNFQGRSVSPPRMMQTPGAIRAFVRSTPGALGIIRAADVDSSVVVMSIDGARPGTPGYKLVITQ